MPEILSSLKIVIDICMGLLILPGPVGTNHSSVLLQAVDMAGHGVKRFLITPVPVVTCRSGANMYSTLFSTTCELKVYL